ncbi:MAG: hypothetical protein Q9188_003911 [Gyalolechia gomerana]
MRKVEDKPELRVVVARHAASSVPHTVTIAPLVRQIPYAEGAHSTPGPIEGLFKPQMHAAPNQSIACRSGQRRKDQAERDHQLRCPDLYYRRFARQQVSTSPILKATENERWKKGGKKGAG